MTDFSTKAKEKTAALLHAAIHHPFNQELMSGSLEPTVFSYYIEQDRYFLESFAKCHALIAAKMPLSEASRFLTHAQHCISAEQSLYSKFLSASPTHTLTPATIGYGSYLLKNCLMEPVEVALAAIAPCFWIYREVGMAVASQATSTNPYAAWIGNYANPAFSQSVDEIMTLLDHMAEKTSPSTRAAMEEAFVQSSWLEVHFWDEAYHQRSLGQMLPLDHTEWHYTVEK